MKYAILTFGCRVNQADSLGFEEELRALGGTAASSAEQADLIILNTCSVTASADQSARLAVRRLARTNPRARVVVTGCYATRKPDQFRELPNVLRVIPNDDKPRLVSILRSDPSTAERFGDGDGGCGAAIEPGIAGRTAFTLRVQTGCAQSCAYCIIPTTRGKPRSASVEGVLAEVDRVVAAGFKEIALTGVHLGRMVAISAASSLIELFRALADHGFPWARGAPPPLARAAALEDSLSSRGPQALLDHFRPEPNTLFRISSLEPMDCTSEIVSLVASSDSFAPHFHLPLQHASNRVLTAMRRPYTIDYYASLVDSIRARMASAAIGSDIIVGFPGETDADFKDLCAYLVQSPLTHLHVFPYSDRPGTAATARTAKVHGAVIRDRAACVREIGRKLAASFRESQVGTVHRGLTIEDGTLVVTGNYLKVRIPPGRQRNEWVRVRVTGTSEAGMTGDLVDEAITQFHPLERRAARGVVRASVSRLRRSAVRTPRDITPPALSHRDGEVVIGEDLREPVDGLIRRSFETECQARH